MERQITAADSLGGLTVVTDANGRWGFARNPDRHLPGGSTLGVVGNLKSNLPEMKDRLASPVVDLKLVMDQSVYVESAIQSLTMEGVLGAVLCSLVIPGRASATRPELGMVSPKLRYGVPGTSDLAHGRRGETIASAIGRTRRRRRIMLCPTFMGVLRVDFAPRTRIFSVLPQLSTS